MPRNNIQIHLKKAFQIYLTGVTPVYGDTDVEYAPQIFRRSVLDVNSRHSVTVNHIRFIQYIFVIVQNNVHRFRIFSGAYFVHYPVPIICT